ncbi:MAG: DUF72 domain-containing protein [Planctomycetota bacterium]
MCCFASVALGYLLGSGQARQYDTVEVDQRFWSLLEGVKPKLPDPEDVADYRHSVSSDFRLSVKAPNAITLTHDYNKN